MVETRNTNPFNLKSIEEDPKNYLRSEDFIKLLNKNKISVREDNLPRFAFRHDIKMMKGKREGSAGTAPTIYRIITKSKIDEMMKDVIK